MGYQFVICDVCVAGMRIPFENNICMSCHLHLYFKITHICVSLTPILLTLVSAYISLNMTFTSNVIFGPIRSCPMKLFLLGHISSLSPSRALIFASNTLTQVCSCFFDFYPLAEFMLWIFLALFHDCLTYLLSSDVLWDIVVSSDVCLFYTWCIPVEFWFV